MSPPHSGSEKHLCALPTLGFGGCLTLATSYLIQDQRSTSAPHLPSGSWLFEVDVTSTGIMERNTIFPDSSYRLSPGSLLVLFWFCPGSVLVLSWCLFWFCPGSVQVLFWFSSGSLLVLFWFSPGSLLVLSWFSPGSLLVSTVSFVLPLDVAAPFRSREAPLRPAFPRGW